MGLIHKVIDLYDDGSVKWNGHGWGSRAENKVCIMGAIGWVLQPENILMSTRADIYTAEERKEVRTFFRVLKEQYPEFKSDLRKDLRRNLGEFSRNHNNRLTFEGITDAIMHWNDTYAKTFEGDVLPMLEKTAIKLAEKV